MEARILIAYQYQCRGGSSRDCCVVRKTFRARLSKAALSSSRKLWRCRTKRAKRRNGRRISLAR